MVRSGSHALGVDPLQSLHVLPAVRSLPTGSGFLEVLRPFDDVPRTSPVMQRSVRLAAVPLAGFLNLSAVSWQVRASRPCLMPLPPVGFSLRSVAPRWDRVLLSESLAPLQFSTTVPEVRCTRPRPPGFTDAPARTGWPGSPPELRHRFHHPAPHALAHGPAMTSSMPWTACSGVTSFRRLRLLRSFPPPASPYARRAAFADAPRPVLPWAWPLQSFDSDRTSDPRMTRRTIPSAAR
jgi:hypothetical protein